MDDKRFVTILKEGNSLTNALKMILLDKKTGVNYLLVQRGYGAGLTPPC